MKVVVLLLPAFRGPVFAQQALTFEQIVQRFRMNNPELLAGQLFVQESQANEVTAGLRPNPELSFASDQFQIAGSPFRPFSTSQIIPSVSQLFERRNKRGLRIEKFESDLANAEVNLRTAKIQLLALMNDRSPVDSFEKRLPPLAAKRRWRREISRMTARFEQKIGGL